MIEDGIGGAEGLTINIGARNDAYGTGLAEELTKAWEAKGGTVGETVVYDVELPSYNSEAAQIVSGSPDAIMMIDFPDPFDKVGAALVRTGDYDPTITFGAGRPRVPEPRGAHRRRCRRGHAGNGARRPRREAARSGVRHAVRRGRRRRPRLRSTARISTT